VVRRYYFDAIRSPAFKLSFTVNHAHLVPEGIAGFVDALDMSRVEEVRIADWGGVGFQSLQIVLPRVRFGSFPAVPARQRRGRSTSISGPPPRGPERTELAIRHPPAG
jgi:hypothetical protein